MKSIEKQTELFLAHVDDRLEQVLKPHLGHWGQEIEVLHKAAHHICFAKKAKRARPKLVYLFGQTVGAEKGLLEISVASELVHTASLLHDDVVDAGNMRRDKPSVNAHWGNLVAVLTGDLMLSTALVQLEDLAPKISHEAVRVVQEMTRAAILEVQVRGNLDIPLTVWQSIAEGKTGVLFAWCGSAPALTVGNTQAAENFAKCGRHVGIAFQMADDLKDIQSAEMGKDRFADIANKNPSYPLLLAAQRSPSLNKELSKAWKKETLESEEVEKLGLHVLDTGVAEMTLQRIGDEICLAMDYLETYQQQAGCAEIIAWAQQLWKGIR